MRYSVVTAGEHGAPLTSTPSLEKPSLVVKNFPPKTAPSTKHCYADFFLQPVVYATSQG